MIHSRAPYRMLRLLGVAALAAALPAAATVYHLDSRTGDDANDGTSPERAWRSLERVGQTELQPGDRLLLRAGCEWTGQLAPRGSGREGAPIVIDRYDDGPLPAVHGRGRVAWVFRLENQQYWEVNSLELTNFTAAGPPQRHRAVEIRARDLGWVRHIHLRNLLVHHVNAVADYRDDGDTVAKSFGGIVTIIDGDQVRTAWDGLLVEGCEIRDTGPMGLVMLSSWMKGHRENDPATWFPSHHVVIRGNTFERLARNGLVVRGCQSPLIEHNIFRECGRLGSGNAMFVFHCDDALVQYNESSHTRYNPGDSDAAGFDSDYNCRRSVFQYNYSHDNDYGFLLVCALGGPRARGFNEGTIVRYNISENDGGNLIRFSGVPTDTLIHNNTFYVKPDTHNLRNPGSPPWLVYHKNWQGWSHGVRFVNNIIYNDSPHAEFSFGESTKNVYENNLFFGLPAPAKPVGAATVASDPRFAGVPGTAGPGRAHAVSVYSLRSDSSARGAGVLLPGHPATDFAGRPVMGPDGRVDLGALGVLTQDP